MFKDRMYNVIKGFKSRNYTLFFTGQGISLIGTWMQRTAMSWLVFRLTGSVFWLGLIGFIGQSPSFIVSPFGGVLADRFHRHSSLKVLQCFAMLQATILTILVLSGKAVIWEIAALSFMLGIIEALDTPVRQSFVIDMVGDRSLVPNAIALNSAMFNGARLIGPSVAGYIVAKMGEGYCFLINSVSYVAILFSLFQMRIPRVERKPLQGTVFQHIKEGFNYTFSIKPMRVLITNIAIFSLFGMSYVTLLPYVAKNILHGDAQTLGHLLSLIGLGALCGAIYLASRKSAYHLERLISLFGVLAGSCMILFSLIHNTIITHILVVFIGFGTMMQMAGSNTLIQTLVDDEKRGRVMSFYAMSFGSMMPLGNLLAGTLSKYLGVLPTITLSGSIFIANSLFFYTRGSIIRDGLKNRANIKTLTVENPDSLGKI